MVTGYRPVVAIFSKDLEGKINNCHQPYNTNLEMGFHVLSRTFLNKHSTIQTIFLERYL